MMEMNTLIEKVLDAAFKVHRALGPGLLESSYESCLGYEFGRTRVPFQRQVPIPVIYEGHHLDCGYRADLLVDRRLIVEIKSVARLEPIYTAQVLTYLRLGGFQVGLLMNFNTKLLKDGLRRLVWNYEGPRPSHPA